MLCESVGTPTPNVTWMFKGASQPQPVALTERTNGKVTQRVDGHLLITNASYKESGEYFCVSRSPGLTRNASGMINVYGRCQLIPDSFQFNSNSFQRNNNNRQFLRNSA